jgi:hypothetical protein
LAYSAGAQTTVYNNFGPNQSGWDYNFAMGWTVAGTNVPSQYGVEQAMDFTSTTDGEVSDIWVAFFYVPFSTPPDTVTIKLARNPNGFPPTPADVMEQWVITTFESWSQWTPPIHLEGNGSSQLQTGENYWLWAMGAETTWCGWCLNIDPALTCAHTMRREGEDWLPVANETASAFRVDVNSAATVAVTLMPLNPPIVIPANGGSFQFTATALRAVGPQAPFAVWARIMYPDGSYTNPTIGPVSINPPVGVTVTRQRSQNIPGGWPAGVYTYLGYGSTSYAYPALDSSSFTFTKSATSNGGPFVMEANCWGELFPGEQSQTAVIPSGLELGVSPNPFNPTTALSYKLQAASYVSLKVYDTTGRLVATLLEGWREVGTHEVTFDGSGLASGIYLAKLEAGGFNQTQKLVLLK